MHGAPPDAHVGPQGHCYDHWQEVAWREKGGHLADETAALKILQLKRCCLLSPDTRSGKC